MAVTRTFSIIKPDATRRNLTGAVTKMLEEADLRVVASKRIHMTQEQAESLGALFLCDDANAVVRAIARIASERVDLVSGPPAPLYVRAADAAPSRDTPPPLLDP